MVLEFEGSARGNYGLSRMRKVENNKFCIIRYDNNGNEVGIG